MRRKWKAKREHAQYRNLKNFYFDDVTKKQGSLSDLKRVLIAFQTVNFFENWHMERIFLFLVARKKSPNFWTYINVIHVKNENCELLRKLCTDFLLALPVETPCTLTLFPPK